MILCVVACGKLKIWNVKKDAPSRVPAREAYIGPLTRLAIKYAEKFFPDSWVILSAKYGFVLPDEMVENYDKTFKNVKVTDDLVLKLRRQAEEKGLLKHDIILVIGGRAYCDVCRRVFYDRKVLAPLEGRGLGEMIKILSMCIRTGRNLLLECPQPSL